MIFLDRYKELINQAIAHHQFKNKPSELYDPINYSMGHGGKRLRPILLLLANDLFEGDFEKALKPALSIELFHNFTLIHDDIMDNADLRRNEPTVKAKYGDNVAILSGDALLIKSYQFFEDLEPVLFKKCIKILSKNGVILCEGQQLDINFETQEKVSYEEYIEMITNKTGVLSAACLQLGALIAGAEEKQADLLYEFGINLGIAFQIMDDYLDTFGDEKSFGKNPFGDINENKKTILYLLALEHANDEDRKMLQNYYLHQIDDANKVSVVLDIFKRTQAGEKALQLVKEYHDKALSYLEKVDRTTEQKQNLVKLADYLLKREV